MDDMSEGILRVTNHRNHPTNPYYKVSFFTLMSRLTILSRYLKSVIYGMKETWILVEVKTCICLV